MLEAQFVRLENWNSYREPGRWPDPDMLPLGRLALGARDTRFTPDEQQTLMTLWAITRSPLIMGGDLRHLDAATLALLTNREVLAVNQSSSENQHFELNLAPASGPRGLSRAAISMWRCSTPPAKPKQVGPADRIGLAVASGVFAISVDGRRAWAYVVSEIMATLPAHGAGLYRVSSQ